MSELKRIIRPELEAIVEEGIRLAQEREARVLVTGMRTNMEPTGSRNMSLLGREVFSNRKQRDIKKFRAGRLKQSSESGCLVRTPRP